MSKQDLYDDEATEIEVPKLPTKKSKKAITEKQRQARIANLAAGRAKRMENLKAKKAPIEYDLDSDDDDDEDESSDDDEFVLSKKKKKPVVKKVKSAGVPAPDLRNELQELRGMMYKMAKQQKKAKPKQGGNKIVVLPAQQSNSQSAPSSEYNSSLNQLLHAIGRK